MTETVPFKAIERMYNEEFDIFLMDYKMPYTTGIELLEKIKKLQGHRKHVSIFYTAYGTTYLFEKEHDRGLFDFFSGKAFENGQGDSSSCQGGRPAPG